MKKVAIIDMGTNTFHLLVAEVSDVGYRILHRDHEAVRIGMGGINEGFITEKAKERALAALVRFRKSLDDQRVTDTYAFGTSALRSAKNGQALATEIEALTGIRVRIISGNEEADLIFAGIRAAIDLKDTSSLVMDIGAGSVEFIIGDSKQLFWKQSFEMGGQRLLEKFQKHDPIASDEVNALDVYFKQMLDPLADALQIYSPGTLVGSSGSFDTLSEIYCARQGLNYDPGAGETPLSKEGYYDIYRELLRKSRQERMNIPGMIALRVDMIVVACCLIRYVLEMRHFENIRVSTYSLKEGALSLIARTHR